MTQWEKAVEAARPAIAWVIAMARVNPSGKQLIHKGRKP